MTKAIRRFRWSARAAPAWLLALIPAMLPVGAAWGAVAPEARAADHDVEGDPGAALQRNEDLPAEAGEFDFWIGRWDVDLREKQDDGEWKQKTTAVAEIHPVIGGKAILELWNSRSIKGFSIRYFDAFRRKWVVWLNWPGSNRSGSFGLEGGFRHGRGEFLATRTNPDGQEILSRYTFSDITPTSLRWDDAFSSDGGRTWAGNWIMEFSRTARNVSLPHGGGPAHTFENGTLCNKPEFRRFESLAGSLTGTARWSGIDGASAESGARLTGYRILGGCAVLGLLEYEMEGVTRERLFVHTWNTYAQMFEELALDGTPESSLGVFYGQGDPEGRIDLLLSGRNGGPRGSVRHVWTLGGDRTSIEMLSREGDEDAWRPVRVVELKKDP